MSGHHLGSARISFWFVLWLVVSTALPCAAATEQQVDESIKKGIEFLYSKQGSDGTWERSSHPKLNKGHDPQLPYDQRQWGGLTAIATYALLASGETPQEAKLKPALEFLEKANIQSTYALGVNSLVWLYVPPTPKTKMLLAHNARMFELGMIKSGDGAGLFTYWTGTKEGTESPIWTNNTVGFGPQKGQSMPFDMSNSQYGILGMWGLSENGVEVKAEFWKRAQDGWEKAQRPDGGWRYDTKPEHKVSASMTAAGIATLYILQDFTTPDHWNICNGSAPNPYIEKGLAWMDREIDKVVNTPGYYTMYGLQRIGVASGRKYFGTTDWYEKGADFIVKHQKPDGSWIGKGELHAHDPITDTCFALLFLSRGRAPVLMNKLQYETTSASSELSTGWNERPRDVANLARWAGRQLERDLNWQVVNLKVPPEELHDAPILYISGSQRLDLDAKSVEKLRTFVQEGGMIVGNPDCGKEAFANTFMQLGRKLFPKYNFRPLPATHPIFTREQYMAANWRARPEVKALSNGVRELMILLPESDPGRAWQTRSDRSKEQLFELGADIFLYSVDKKHLQNKGETYVVEPDAKIKPTRKIKLARLMVGENPDPEPGAWRQFAAVMHNRQQIDLSFLDAQPGGGLLAAAKVAHLTGTTAFTLSESARLEIKTFVQNGGTLIVDAAGGSGEFAAAAENELRTIFGPDARQLDTPLPPSSPVFNQQECKIESVMFRTFAREILLHGVKQPRIRGITFGNRVRVFYSREDLTAGLVGEPVDGIFGYEPQSATDLVAAMLMYATSK